MSSYRTLLKVGEFLFETGKTLFAETDLGKLLPLAMDKVIEQTKAQRGMIILYGPGGEQRIEVARDHHQKNITDPEEEISTTILQRLLESGKKYDIIGDAAEDPNFNKSQSIERIGIRSVAIAPLQYEDKVLGLIYVDHRGMPANFTEETGELLSEFAKLISAAVKKALEFRWSELERQRLKSEAEQTVLKLRQQSERRRQLERLLAVSEGFDEIKGIKSMAMLEVFNLINRAAPTSAPVLILGETGVGKELVARALHGKSTRLDQPFVKINCAGLAETLLESDLFGHVKGAFTGADKDKMGFFEIADGGTIFLDEIAKSSIAFQTKLLGVLESGEFRRMGETTAESRTTDVRIIAAGSPNLRDLIKQDRFFLDLFHRLNVVEILVPPLRDRHEDIPELVEFFLQRYIEKHEKIIHGLSSQTHDLLLRYSWPGNVRELEHTIERAVILADGEIIQANDLPQEVLGGEAIEPEALGYAEAKKIFERTYFGKLLQKTNGNIATAARLAGMDKSNLRRKLIELGINAKDFEK